MGDHRLRELTNLIASAGGALTDDLEDPALTHVVVARGAKR